MVEMIFAMSGWVVMGLSSVSMVVVTVVLEVVDVMWLNLLIYLLITS